MRRPEVDELPSRKITTLGSSRKSKHISRLSGQTHKAFDGSNWTSSLELIETRHRFEPTPSFSPFKILGSNLTFAPTSSDRLKRHGPNGIASSRAEPRREPAEWVESWNRNRNRKRGVWRAPNRIAARV